MVNERFQPYDGRSKYRSWLQNRNPVAPRATADRIRARQHPGVGAEANGRMQGRIQEEPPPEDVSDNTSSEDEVNEANENEMEVPGYQPPPQENNTETSSSSESQGTSSSSNSESEESSSDEENEHNEPPFQDGLRKDEDLENNVYPGIQCTKFECLLMILNFSFRHGLTYIAITDLCVLINSILNGNYLPFSKHIFSKIFGNTPYNYHFYCRKCEAYLGLRHDQDRRIGRIVCQVCEEVCNLGNMNDGHFFITFPLKQQIQHLLQNTDNVINLLRYRQTRDKDDNFISDVYDGEIYKSLTETGQFLSNPNNISLTFSTDGAQVYDSCKNTLWPLLFRINEFPPSVRFDFSNSMVGAVWFGRSEPSMSLFLKSFVSEANDLYENGFTWTSPTGDVVKSKCILLNCVADSKAKPLVQSVKTHSGFYGCGYCRHPGKTFQGSSQAKYPLNNDLVQLQDYSYSYTVTATDPHNKDIERIFAVEDRTNDQIREDMVLAEAARNERGEGDVWGVKGKSVLWAVLYFDLVFGFVVDYMHAVLLGVVKHVTGLWLDSSSTGNLYYIGLRISDLDKKLLNIKPHKSISRRPRTLMDRCHWKANEWRSWLLYYSLPCLKGILPSRYLKHHCLLVSATHLLLQDKISRQDLMDAMQYLGAYCVQFCILYSESLVYFNVHLLLHLGKCVNLYGPLFCYSAFSFESATGRLVNLVKGSRGVLFQIANKYTKCKMIPRLLRMYNISERTYKYCDVLTCYRSNQDAKRFNDVTVLGSEIYVPFQDGELNCLQNSGHQVTNKSYECMIISKSLYHARCRRRKSLKSDSSVVKLKCGSYGAIMRIIDAINFRGPGEARPIILLKTINVEREAVVNHHSGAKATHIKPCSLIVYGNFIAVTTDDISASVILMNCIDRSYVAEFPNRYEKD